MNTTNVLTTVVVLALIGVPTLSSARARGGDGGGYSSGSRGGSASGGIGSRGARTFDNNGYRPIERSTTPKPSSPPLQPAPVSPTSTPTAKPTPAMQPSFLQQHPLLAGIAGGIAGSWIGHMLFGATTSDARTSDVEGTRETNDSSGSPGLLLVLMLLGAGGLYYVMRARRTPEPDFSGVTRSSMSGAPLALTATAGPQTAGLDTDVPPADQIAFQQILIDVQTAWGKQDLSALRRLVTPEMLNYFSHALSENTSQEVENRVEDVSMVSVDVREAWTEGTTQYGTGLCRWTARDYTVSLAKQRGEPGYLVDGKEDVPTECVEVWTFMRAQQGKWLLSAIQPVD